MESQDNLGELDFKCWWKTRTNIDEQPLSWNNTCGPRSGAPDIISTAELLQVSGEWIRNNTLLIFGNYDENDLLLFTLKLSTEKCHLFSLSGQCVWHIQPAASLSSWLSLGVETCSCFHWRGHTALHPPALTHSSKNASGIYPEPCWVLSLVVKLQQHVLGKGREQDPRYPSKQSCGTRSGHCHLQFHYLSFGGS